MATEYEEVSSKIRFFVEKRFKIYKKTTENCCNELCNFIGVQTN